MDFDTWKQLDTFQYYHLVCILMEFIVFAVNLYELRHAFPSINNKNVSK